MSLVGGSELLLHSKSQLSTPQILINILPHIIKTILSISKSLLSESPATTAAGIGPLCGAVLWLLGYQDFFGGTMGKNLSANAEDAG